MYSFLSRIFNHQIVYTCLLLFVLPIILTEAVILRETHGVISYPFDDAFIHLSIARNLAYYGTWGINPEKFSSASSSVLYPLLLAGLFKLVGARVFLPLLINVVAGGFYVIALCRWLNRQALSPPLQVVITTAAILLIPLPVIAMFGMEHSLHILFCFLFIYGFGGAMDTNQRIPLPVYLYGLLVTATRYESLFIVIAACLYLVAARRWKEMLQLGAAAALPVLIFGVISLYKGSYFIPNSVLIKSVTPPLTPAGLWNFITKGAFDRLYYAHLSVGGIAIQWLLALLIVFYLVFRTQVSQKKSYRLILLLTITACITHLLFAQTGVLFRYEAYLPACGLPVAGVLLFRYAKGIWEKPINTGQWALVFCGLLLIVPLCLRSYGAFQIPGQGSINIYDMQYQMGRFVRQYYPHTPVAIGDIGAVSWFSHAKNLDLEGLGNLEVAKSRKEQGWTPGFLQWMCRKDSATIAIVFDRSYPAALRRQWTKVAEWQIPDNIACYSNVVSFYAIDSTAVTGLRKNVAAFADSIPAEVIVRL